MSDTTISMSKLKAEQNQISQANFRFKQFGIWHDRCAMKVNTDGILLGAWSHLNSNSSMIDIGTGTGLIALMLAQRTLETSPTSHIVAVEVDPEAASQAEYNISQSQWSTRISVESQDIKNFAQVKEHQNKFSTLVSNPPYFSDALLGQSTQRNLARHNNQLSFSQLLESAEQLATEDALFNLILPIKETDELLSICERFDWFILNLVQVSSIEGNAPHRCLITLARTQDASLSNRPINNEGFFIRDKLGNYGSDFKLLCKDFYLKF